MFLEAAHQVKRLRQAENGQNRSLRNCTRNCNTKNLGTHALLRLELELEDYLSGAHLYLLITLTASAIKILGVEALVSEELRDGSKDFPAEPAEVENLLQTPATAFLG